MWTVEGNPSTDCPSDHLQWLNTLAGHPPSPPTTLDSQMSPKSWHLRTSGRFLPITLRLSHRLHSDASPPPPAVRPSRFMAITRVCLPAQQTHFLQEAASRGNRWGGAGSGAKKGSFLQGLPHPTAQPTLEQQGFELCRSTQTWIFLQ